MAEYDLKTPICEKDVTKLKIGDIIYLSGTIFLSRDEAHLRALEFHKEGKSLPIDIKELAVYHCGPVVKQNENGEWEVVVAGPTTSTRMEIFQDEYIEKFGIRVVIGKGGMGDRTAKAMQKYKAVYTAFVGGAAVLASKAIKKVTGAYWLDLGTPEAFWVIEVERFGPLIVGIDTFGNNLYKDVMKEAEKNKAKIAEILEINL